jgi:Domain of unknown function (DUF4350)
VKRRWYKLWLPFAVVFLVIAGTITVHSLVQPDQSEEAYLSPILSGPTSGVRLAEMLRAKGITVNTQLHSSDALTAAWKERGKATLFIPAPTYMHPDYLWMLRNSPSGTRIVLVEPDAGELADAVPPLGLAGKRWATAVTEPGPGCPLTTAGAAGVTRSRYAAWSGEKDDGTYCYEHGLAQVARGGVEFVVVGSADPFRDDRLAENDNARLAVDLLTTRPTLVWLDLHRSEPKPKSYSEDLPGPGGPIPSFAPGDERPRGGSPRPRPSASRSVAPAGGGVQEQQDPPSPFPPWVPPAFVLLALIGLVLVFARGRRLGAPVTEPLPIEVRGAETALGRSRLYRKAKARGAALETLRFEARRRLSVALGLPPSTERDALLEALAARTGSDREGLANVLFGPEPEDDDELQQRTTELLLLVERVTRGSTQ